MKITSLAQDPVVTDFQIAALDIAFQDFSHPGDSQELIWDTQRADGLRNLLVHVDVSTAAAYLREDGSDLTRTRLLMTIVLFY